MYSRFSPHTSVSPGPRTSARSCSSSTYCCSFFQLSSRRASTCCMNASRSFGADAACPPGTACVEGPSINSARTAATGLMGSQRRLLRIRDSGAIRCGCRSGYARELSDHNARGLALVALVPPEAVFQPPAILALIVEQHATAPADVVLQFYVRILLFHGLFIYLDFAGRSPVP